MVSFLLFGGIEVQTHDFKRKALLIQFVSLLKLRLVNHLAESALLPLLIAPLLPVLLRLLQRLLQVLLVLGVVELVGEIASIAVGQVSVDDLDVAWTDHYLQIFTQLGQIDRCPRKGSQNRLRDVLVERAGGSDGDGVAEDHIEAFLIDGVLTLGLDDLLLAGISQQHVLQSLIGGEAGADGVVVHPLLPLVGEVLSDIEVGVLGRLHQISVHLKRKSTEIAVIHSAALQDLLPDVFPEGLDDEVKLGLGIERLDGLVGPRLGGLVFPGVILLMGDDPA